MFANNNKVKTCKVNKATIAIGARHNCAINAAPRAISNHGTIGATQRGAPNSPASIGHRSPRITFEPPATHINAPRITDAIVPIIDQPAGGLTLATLPRKKTIASETSSPCAMSRTRPTTKK